LGGSVWHGLGGMGVVWVWYWFRRFGVACVEVVWVWCWFECFGVAWVEVEPPAALVWVF